MEGETAESTNGSKVSMKKKYRNGGGPRAPDKPVGLHPEGIQDNHTDFPVSPKGCKLIFLKNIFLFIFENE